MMFKIELSTQDVLAHVPVDDTPPRPDGMHVLGTDTLTCVVIEAITVRMQWDEHCRAWMCRVHQGLQGLLCSVRGW